MPGKPVQAQRGREQGGVPDPCRREDMILRDMCEAEAIGSGTDGPRKVSRNSDSSGTLGHAHLQSTGHNRAAASAHGRVGQRGSLQLADPILNAPHEGGKDVGQTEWVDRSMKKGLRWEIRGWMPCVE